MALSRVALRRYAFMVLAIVAQGWVGRAYVALGAAVGVILTAMFALWYWVA